MSIIHDQTLSNQSYIISNRRHYSNNTLSLMSITEQNSIKLKPREIPQQHILQQTMKCHLQQP